MDALPPPNDETLITFLRAIAAAFFGLIGASFSSLDKKVHGLQLLWHLGLAFFLCGLSFCVFVGTWPNVWWIVWLLPSFVMGFGVYGIAVALRRNSKSVEDVDAIHVIQRKTGTEGDKP